MISPNPFKDILSINVTQLESTTFNLNIYDRFGNNKYTKLISSKDRYIDLSYLKKGIYYLTITSGKKLISRVIIKE